MLLGMMQPYFFPYLGYFDLISRSDRWIFFDTAQYIRHGWVNRNRILRPTGGWQYIVVPLRKHEFDIPINKIRTMPVAEWRGHMLGQLLHYRKHAPYFRQTMALVEECLATDDCSLLSLNVRATELVCKQLEIRWQGDVLSQLQLDLGVVDRPDDWALRACQAIGADAYINPPGGVAIYDPARFEAAGVKFSFQDPLDYSYPCPGYQFEPNLSIVDVLMWNSPGEIKRYLDRRAGR